MSRKRKLRSPAGGRAHYGKGSEASRRFLFDLLRFWRACPEPRCRRVRACVGDLRACHRRRWAPVPDDEKFWMRKWLEAVAAGATPEEAFGVADAAAARVAAETEAALADPETAQ